MATFNPNVQPVGVPNLSVSSPTPAGAPDTSFGQVLKTIGEGITGAVKLADEGVKGYITDTAQKGVDSVRDAYTQYLVNANAGVQTNTDGTLAVPAAVQSPTGPQGPNKDTLLPENQPDAPAGIQNGIDRYARITQAQSQNSGTKANDTAYTAQLTSIAKNLRAQWPGYRNYIDEQVSQISGIPIANAYVKNLLQDLNTAQNGAKAQQTKVQEALLEQVKAGVPGSTQAYAGFMQNGDINHALSFVESANASDHAAKAATASLALSKSTDDNIASKAKTNLQSVFADDINLQWQGAAVGAGIKSPGDWVSVINNAGQNGTMPNSPEQQQAATALASKRAEIESGWRLKAQAPITITNPDGSKRVTNYANLVGGMDVVNNMIKENLATFDTYTKAATDDKTGTATYAARATSAYKQDVENGIVTDPVNIKMVKIGVMNQEMGSQVTSALLTEALRRNVDSTVSNLLSDKTNNMLLQPDRPKGIINTFKADVAEAAAPTASKNGPIQADTRYYDELVQNVNKIADSKLPMDKRENAAVYFFDPINRGTLTSFNQDSFDSTGNRVGGRETIFKVLTSPKISTSIAEISKNNPQIGINYKNYVETEWGTAILGPRLQELKEITEGNASKQISIPGGVHMAFDDGSKGNLPKLFMIDKNGVPLVNAGKTDIEKNYFKNLQTNLDFINEGMGNLKAISTVLGGSVGSTVLQSMHDAGIDIPNNKVGQAVLRSTPNKELDEIEKNTGVNIRRKTVLPESE